MSRRMITRFDTKKMLEAGLETAMTLKRPSMGKRPGMACGIWPKKLTSERNNPMEQSEIQGLPEMWAVIELFGHQRAAGKLSTQNIGAVALIRLDVPEVTRKERSYDWGTRAEVTHEVTTPAHTRFFGVGAIYSINPCSEETARAELARIGNPPIVQMEVERMKMLKAPPDAIDSMACEAAALNAALDKLNQPELWSEGPDESTGQECPACHYGDCEVVDGVIRCPECGATTPLPAEGPKTET